MSQRRKAYFLDKLSEENYNGASGHVRDYVYAGSRLLAAVDKANTTSPANR